MNKLCPSVLSSVVIEALNSYGERSLNKSLGLLHSKVIIRDDECVQSLSNMIDLSIVSYRHGSVVQFTVTNTIPRNHVFLENFVPPCLISLIPFKNLRFRRTNSKIQHGTSNCSPLLTNKRLESTRNRTNRVCYFNKSV